MPPPSLSSRTFAGPLFLQFEGDRDTKRPCDFNARSLQDHEEDEDDDEDNPPVRSSKKRTESGSIKPAPAPQARPQPASVSPPPHKRARVESIDIPSDATPAATNSTPAQPLPPSLLHPSLQPLLAQSLQSHLPSSNPQYSLAHIYNMVQQHSLPPDAPAALLNLLRSGAFQSGRFGSQQPNQNPGHSDSFLASLAELASTNPGISDTIGNGLGGYGLGPGGSAFDWPTGLGSSSNTQEPQPSTSASLLSICSDPLALALIHFN